MRLIVRTDEASRNRWARYLLVLVVFLVFAGSRAARWLVVDDPQKSDVILVLAGETDDRPRLGLSLLAQHYASRLVLDVPAELRIFDQTAPELAERWMGALPDRQSISICPIHGLSTIEEAHEAAGCLEHIGGQHILLVTSDFHTRRAVSTFRHANPRLTFSVAAAYNSQAFGTAWWTHREWAKTTWYEWTRLLWWECVDRWR